MHKKNFISKNWLKFTNAKGYASYKSVIKNQQKNEALKELYAKINFDDKDSIIAKATADGMVNAVHSGNAGDVLYALPTLKKIYEETGLPVNLYLKLGTPIVLPAFFVHPLGGVMLNAKMAEMLIPLLSLQPYINSCEVYTNQHINLDMDAFRVKFFPSQNTNIARWCSYITGFNLDLWKSWLAVKPDTSFSDTIIVARSERYRNILIDHSFLNQYKNISFIGVQSEYDDIRQTLPNIKWLKVDDFLKLAQIIAGCKFFIGNQSFPFSIAEALKVPRILEVSLDVVNVIPEGPNGYDFLFQTHFESLVKELDQSY